MSTQDTNSLVDECAYEFSDWIVQLNAVAASNGNVGYVQTGNEDSWRGYFDDGRSPEDAYQEDCSYD